jgi:hypothetical protein
MHLSSPCSLAFAALAQLAVLILPTPLWSASPSAGTLSDTSSGPLTYTAGPFTTANPTPILLVDSGPQCANSVQPCDDFALTLALPAAYTAALLAKWVAPS